MELASVGTGVDTFHLTVTMMMNSTKRILIALLAGLGLASQAHAIPTYGVTDNNQLITFDSASPGVIVRTVSLGAVTGMVRGIDVRPGTGELFALSTQGQNSFLSVINPLTGAVISSVAISGPTIMNNHIGFDFNPTNGMIRVTNQNNQNLSVNPATGVATAQTPLNPGNPQVAGSAYTNSFGGSTATTLYDIDFGTDALYIQNPPANGTLVQVGAGLGFDTTNDVGFDIFFLGNQAFASLTVGGVSGLYGINLVSGTATSIGAIGSGALIRDIAVAQVPEPATGALLGLGLLGLALSARRKRR